MTKLKNLKARFMEDPEFREQYARIDEEYVVIEALVRARTAAKLTQTELARRLGTTQSAVARLEGGRVSPSLATLRRYAEATGTRLTVDLVPARGRDMRQERRQDTRGMDEINQIWFKYEDQSLLDGVESLDDVNRLALTFGKDVARTYRLITLRRNPVRCPFGYGLADAPIVGLLARVAKLFQLVCKFYELGNGDYLAVFSRPLIESAIIATYLLRNGDEAVEDFRRCSYKETLRILRAYRSGAEFFRKSAGQRVLQSALDDLAIEGLSKESFAAQKRNRWRLQGKSLYDIFGEIADPAEYPFVYGILSESTHGSWNESMDWCLSRNDDNTFSTFALYHSVDARAILPLVRFATPPYVLWSDRIQIQDDAMRRTFDRINDYSRSIYLRFDELYDRPTIDDSTSSEWR